MKKLLIISFLLVVVLLYSCKKEAEHEIEKVEANITLAPGEEFRFELKKYIKDKQFPLITKAPDKSLASTIIYNDVAVGPYYKYIPDVPGGRSDKVIIKIIKEHEHNPSAPDEHEENDDHTSVIITLNFSIQ
jgi:hypothetical protein